MYLPCFSKAILGQELAVHQAIPESLMAVLHCVATLPGFSAEECSKLDTMMVLDVRYRDAVHASLLGRQWVQGLRHVWAAAIVRVVLYL